MRWISGFIISLLLLFAGRYSHAGLSPRNDGAHALALAAKHHAGKKAVQATAPSTDVRKRYITRPKYKMAIASDDDDEDDQVEAKKIAQAVTIPSATSYSSFSAHDAHSKAKARHLLMPVRIASQPIYLLHRSIRV